jgi:predicted RNase H-like HicB family nuclease
MITPAAVRCKWILGCISGWYMAFVTFTIELGRETDGRWLAEVPALPGVMCYGAARNEAVAKVQALALRVIASDADSSYLTGVVLEQLGGTTTHG